MGGGSGSSIARNPDGKIKSVRQTMLEFMKIKEMAELNEYRRQMNFPAEVERTSSINIGSGSSQANDEETATSNKSNTYNRNSKRGTRLVRSV